MVTDVTYELMRIGNNLADNTDKDVMAAVNDINNITKEMIESDSQFQFKKGIFHRQYNADVEYCSFNTIRIHVKDDNKIYYISVENFLKVLSFRIWKEIERCGDGFYLWFYKG